MSLPKKTFILCVLCLPLALFFAGCSSDDGGSSGVGLNGGLMGRWVSSGPWGSDGYTVEAKRLDYFFEEEIMFAGAIKYVENFTDSAGVIIIEYDAEYSQPKGNFIGIYFKNLTPGVSVQMGAAWMEGGAEEPSLAAAMAAFTLGNEGTYMSYYGLYLLESYELLLF